MGFSIKPSEFTRSSSFDSFGSLCDELKGTVYAIVRIRRNKSGGTNHGTIGTGFLGGPCRLVTCAHVINDTKKILEGDMNKHKPGDVYLFIQRDETGKKHQVSKEFILGRDLLIYRDIDIAIFKLDEWFYVEGKKFRQHPENYLSFSMKNYRIGTEAGILGYPFNNISFRNDGRPIADKVVIRADKGVVNTKSVFESIDVYEFTIAFNPGNSGGPVIDLETGGVMGVVQGFQWWLVDYKPAVFWENQGGQWQLAQLTPENKRPPEVPEEAYNGVISVTSNYNRAICVSNFKKKNLLKKGYIK